MACSTNTKQTYPTLLLQQIARNTCAIANSQAADVNSVTGTANQITASPATGAVGLSLAGPHAFSTLTANGILVGNGTSPISAPGATLTATAMALGTAYTGGFQLYNAGAPGDANYERLEALWSGNIAFFRNVSGGTGQIRQLRLSVGNAFLDISPLASGAFFTASVPSSSAANRVGFSIPFAGAFTQASGTNVGFGIAPNYNQQTGTAANTDLLINRTETAVGSGSQLLIDAQVGGSSRFSVSNRAVLTLNPQTSTVIQASGRFAIASTSNGVVALTNISGTDFSRLQFGGSTSSFACIKLNSGSLECKLADDSEYAIFAAQQYTLVDGITAPGATAGLAKLFVDTADGDLKIIFGDGTIKTIVTDT